MSEVTPPDLNYDFITRVVGKPLKKCKHCAKSEKLAAQQMQLASHIDEEEDQVVYNNLGSLVPSHLLPAGGQHSMTRL